MGFINDFVELIKQQYLTFGYLIVFLGAYFENMVLLGLVLPGGSLVLLGAVYAADGSLSIWWVVLLGWLGIFLGICTDYWIGRLGVYNLIAKTRLHRYLEEPMAKAEAFLEKRGAVAIFGSFFAGHLRSFVAITAGLTKFPFRKFMLYQAPASFIWNLLYCLAGFFLASTFKNLEGVVGGILVLSLVILAAGYGGLSLFKRLKSRRSSTAKEDLPEIRPAHQQTEQAQLVEPPSKV